jgi:hypothetical protein
MYACMCECKHVHVCVCTWSYPSRLVELDDGYVQFVQFLEVGEQLIVKTLIVENEDDVNYSVCACECLHVMTKCT